MIYSTTCKVSVVVKIWLTPRWWHVSKLPRSSLKTSTTPKFHPQASATSSLPRATLYPQDISNPELYSVVRVSPTQSLYSAARIPLSEPSKVCKYRWWDYLPHEKRRRKLTNTPMPANHTRSKDQHFEEAWSCQFQKSMVKTSQERS